MKLISTNRASSPTKERFIHMYKRLSILVITGLFGVVAVDQVSATPYGGGAGTGAVVASSGASAASGGIPVTGADSGPVLLWALLAVGAGAALVGGVAARRRHSAATDAA